MSPGNEGYDPFGEVSQLLAKRDSLAPRLPVQLSRTIPAPIVGAGVRPTASLSVAAPAAGTGGLSAAEQWLINKESGGRTTAKNPTSTAFGLGQLLLANRKKYLGADYATTDYNKQLGAFRAYVRDRYKTAEAAKSFWEQRRWY